ncbi:hypothetical protein SAMN04487819_10722 [Actinopolyspora alba]|uniref:Uncharacterized protein n=1 Tax=Actinopolyspora alba TaxID=673379 RepID=A0A1I1XAY9_9ACTN|nr:hypothetical protein [Actinopolyspora alba]SFE04545.1 hypothetical protein SAMN04487819_10722 [Actinopolyspora alba]
MSWQRFHRRQQAIGFLLERLARTPDRLPDPRSHDELSDVFADRQRLLCALQHKWTQQLTGRLDTRLSECDGSSGDRLEAARLAWQDTAAENPVLRAALDRHATAPKGELREAVERERRLLALTAGVAEHSEPDAEISRSGAALSRLLHAAEHAEPHTPAPVTV